MINQELISFIKRELQAGKKKDSISEALLVSNWSLHDIEEAFNTIDLLNPNLHVFVNVETPNNKKFDKIKRSIFIILAISVLILGFVLFFYRT